MMWRETKIFSSVYLVLGFLLASTPAWAATYYVDYDSGSDSNIGTSVTMPFRHSPGDPAGTGAAAATILNAGDTVIFKRGVIYKSTIKCNTAGALLLSGSSASITTAGVLMDTNANFTAAGIAAGDYVYIYHSKQSMTNTWVESTGVYKVVSVGSPNQLTLESFSGREYLASDMTYRITRPIIYISIDTWGIGDAVIDGENIRQDLLNLNGKSNIRVKSLKFTNVPNDGGAGAVAGIRGTATGTQVDKCIFTNMGANAMTIYGDYTVVSGCYVSNHGYVVLNTGAYNSYVLFEKNNIVGPGCRSLFGGRFLVIRFNSIANMTRAYGGAHSDSIGFIDGGPNMNNHYGWIYGNTIDNFVEAIALYDNWPNINGGTRYWVIHSNLIIGRLWEKGTGDGGIVCKQCQNNLIANNTIVSSSPTQIGMNIPISLDVDSNNNTVTNNIVYNPGGDSALVYIRKGDPANPTWDCDNNTFDRNHYYTNASTGPFRTPTMAGKKNYATWKSMGYDGNSPGDVGTPPGFVSCSALNFHLYNTSINDIGTGANLSNNLRIDKEMLLRSVTGSYNLGAFDQITVNPGVQTPRPPSSINVN